MAADGWKIESKGKEKNERKGRKEFWPKEKSQKEEPYNRVLNYRSPVLPGCSPYRKGNQPSAEGLVIVLVGKNLLVDIDCLGRLSDHHLFSLVDQKASFTVFDNTSHIVGNKENRFSCFF